MEFRSWTQDMSLVKPSDYDLIDVTDINDNWDTIDFGAGVAGTYTPAISSFTLGDGTLTGHYYRMGYTVYWRVALIVGSTTVMPSTEFKGGLPYYVADDFIRNELEWGYTPVGHIFLHDVSTGAKRIYIATAGQNTENYFEGIVRNAAITTNHINATTPWTWAVGDKLIASGYYERRIG